MNRSDNSTEPRNSSKWIKIGIALTGATCIAAITASAVIFSGKNKNQTSAINANQNNDETGLLSTEGNNRGSLRPSSRPMDTNDTPASSPQTSLDVLFRPTSQTDVVDEVDPNCFTTTVYNSIDADIALLKSTISNSIARSHFLGGIVRLAAHDFMDFDRSSTLQYGPDGCFDPDHDANAGLPSGVWCKGCMLRGLHETKYSFLSRADFWIAAANAVIHQTSVDNALDLRDRFRWGRKDRNSCPESGDRIPTPASCNQVEGAFIDRMGLEWVDAAALMGAHSIGRGDADNSGHEGVWSDNAELAMVRVCDWIKLPWNDGRI